MDTPKKNSFGIPIIREKVRIQAEQNHYDGLVFADNALTLKEMFPNERTPTKSTITQWASKYGWHRRKEIIDNRVSKYNELESIIKTLEKSGIDKLTLENIAKAHALMDDYCLIAKDSRDPKTKKEAIDLLVKLSQVFIKARILESKPTGEDDESIDLKKEFLKKYKDDPEIQKRLEKLADEELKDKDDN